MHRSHRRLAVAVTALPMFLGAILAQSLAAAPADAGRPRPPSTTTTTAPNPGFYSFGLSWSSWNQPSYVIRDGGVVPFATGSHGPFYDFYGYTTSTVHAQSINGFLGTTVSGITITGSSGGVTRTATIPTFTVVDPLPCSTYWGGNPCYG